MIEINGKIYRNLQEQVAKNKDDIDALQQDLTGVYTKTETDTLLDSKADTNTVYTKTEIDMTLVNKANASDVYTKTETDTLLDSKADTSAVYTKTEIDMTLVNKANVDDVYTKNETDTLLNKKADLVDGKIPVEQIPASGTIAEVAKKVIYKDEEKTIEEVLEAEETNYMSATIECNHEKEITGNTGDEHGLAINDQQMLITKIQGQTRRKSFNLINSSKWAIGEKGSTIGTIDSVWSYYIYLSAGTYSFKINNRINNGNIYIAKFVDGSYAETIVSWADSATFTLDKAYVLYLNYAHEGASASVTSEQLSSMNIMLNEGSSILDYEPYDNSLVNSKCDFVSTGRNLCKITYINYHVTANGVLEANDTNWCVSNLIEVKSGTKYTVSGSTNEIFHLFYYDNNSTFISYTASGIKGDNVSYSFETPSNCQFLYVQVGSTYSNIMLNYGDTALPYEPYIEDKMICGLELGAFDYHDNISNKTHKQTSEMITINGSESGWYRDESMIANKYRFVLEGIKTGIKSPGEIGIASNWIDKTANDTWGCNTGISVESLKLVIYIEGITTLDDFKTWLGNNPITFVYKLASETTETNVLPSGYSVYNGGMQIQKTDTIPYTLTKQYSLSISSQILANISIDKDQQAQIDKVKEQINSINDKTNENLLWENGNTNSAFSSQTINVNGLSNYKYIVIGVKLHYDVYGDENVYYVIQYFKFENYTGEFGLSINDYSRNGSINSSNQIYFGNANNNDYIIPVEIYGTNTL